MYMHNGELLTNFSHGEDGSRTPGRSGAWDPTISNTPAHPKDFDDYSFDENSPSPNYNPGTPGYSQESPSGPYTPATPGSVYNPQVIFIAPLFMYRR